MAELCRRLDGIPLALELAAARLRALPLEQLVARLDDRFRLLSGGSRTALRRQQTLRAAIDWSYDLLAVPERALLRRLADFAGGWTLAAAEAVFAGADVGEGVEPADVLELLTGLVDKSLVDVVAAELGVAPGEARYRLLETVRQYAEEKLVAAGEAAPRARHRDWYLAWAERAEPELVRCDQAAWFDRYGPTTTTFARRWNGAAPRRRWAPGRRGRRFYGCMGGRLGVVLRSGG